MSNSNTVDGVLVTHLNQIVDERGKVMHMLREDSPVFNRFGEIYFSCANSGSIKAWKLHKEIILNLAVVHGSLKLVVFDDRQQSPTKGNIQEVFLSPESYSLVTVPPLIWSGFQALGSEMAIVANCASLPHDPAEVERKPPFDPAIPYDWQIQHK
jgi:dTDP-4-dehydrorhamnose 3,5-epimerase